MDLDVLSCNEDTERRVYTELTSVQSYNSTWQNGQNGYEESFTYTPSDHDISQVSFYEPPSNPSNDIPGYLNELKSIIDEPRALLLEQIRTITHDSEPDLEQLRHELFKLASERDDFPIKEGVLRKRLKARRPEDQPIQSKFARDCFVLLRAVVGEYTEELSEVVSTRRKQRELSQKAPTEDVLGMKALREIVVSLQSDVHSLKAGNKVLLDVIENVNTQLKSLQKDKENARERGRKYTDEIKTMQTKVTKLEKENSALCVKVDVQREELNEYNENYRKLEKTVSEALKLARNTKVRVDETWIKISDCEGIAQKFNNDHSSGIEGFKNKLKYVLQTAKNCVNDVNVINESLESTTRCVEQNNQTMVALQKQIHDIKRQAKNGKEGHSEQSASKPPQEHIESSNAATVSPTVSPSQPVSRQSHVTEPQNGKSKTPELADSILVDQTTTKSSTKRPSITEDASNGPSQKTQLPILTHFPSSVCVSDNSEKCVRRKSPPVTSSGSRFVGFIPVKKRRIRKYYIHGIDKRESSANALRDFLYQNEIEYTYLRYFSRSWKHTASAQLNVVDDDTITTIIDDPSFWPNGVHVREWLSRGAFQNQHENTCQL